MTQAVIHQMELVDVLLDSSAGSDRLQLHKKKACAIATRIAALDELTAESALELTTHVRQIFGEHAALVIYAVHQRLESDARVEAVATTGRQQTITKSMILLNKSDFG